MLLATCFVSGLRHPALALQWLAPFPVLGAGLLAICGGALAFEAPTLRLDQLGGLLLAAAALLWIVCGAATFSTSQQWTSQRFAIG